MSEIRVVLDEESFGCLVRGGELTIETPGKPTVKMILSDIGWERMDLKIAEAQTNKKGIYQAHTLKGR